MTFRMLLAFAMVALLFSGCSTTATVEGLTDMTSSSTGETWWTSDGLVKQGQHAELFVALNHENLLQDIAKGEGEYLQAFGQVLNVPSSEQQTFAARLQQNFPDLSSINVKQGGVHLATFINQVTLATKSPSSPLS